MLWIKIVIKGGAINVPGNKNRVAEFNFFVDPEAASIVFNSRIKKTIVPLDACNNVQLFMEDFEKINSEKLKEPILKMMRLYIENIGKDEGIRATLMYDPLTVYSLINPNACESSEKNVLIEIKGELTRGMSVADLRKILNCAPNLIVVEKINEESFRKILLKYFQIKQLNLKDMEFYNEYGKRV